MTAAGLETDVRSLMRPGVVSIGEQSSLEQARRALLSHRVHAILVVGRGGRALGWVTVRDVLARAGRDPGLVTAGSAVGEPAVRVSPATTGREAAALLVECGTARLLVARDDEDHPEGVVGELDLLAASG